ncbi:MAG: hypothetical protein KDE31_37505, partial [Caldilineaceae bacterium]|nr:hypothetical protein [Caldilineaceae bacterium]
MGIANSLIISSIIAYEQGRHNRALAECEEHLQIARQSGKRDTYARGLYNLGLINLESGNLFRAAEQVSEAESIAASIGNYHHQSTCRGYLTEVMVHQGYYKQAQRNGEDALLLADRLGLTAHRGDTSLRLAKASLAAGNLEATRSHLVEASQIYQRGGQELKSIWLLEPLGHLAYAEGNTSKAIDYLQTIMQKGVVWGN